MNHTETIKFIHNILKAGHKNAQPQNPNFPIGETTKEYYAELIGSFSDILHAVAEETDIGCELLNAFYEEK